MNGQQEHDHIFCATSTDRTHRYQTACPVGAESHLQIPHRTSKTHWIPHQNHTKDTRDFIDCACMFCLIRRDETAQNLGVFISHWCFSSGHGNILPMPRAGDASRAAGTGASGPCVRPELKPCSIVPMDITYQAQGQRSNDQEEAQDGGSRVLNQAWRPGRLHRSPACKAGPAGEPSTQPVLDKCFLSK